ncbi:MAG: hypothetical protein KGZ62_09920 [Sulfurimonas sp.]|nr:hypothetical protein [Sulfurimonas sp.]
MTPLTLKYDPVFNIQQDLDRIREAVLQGHRGSSTKTLLFPTSRAYIVTDKFKPVAIFDKLGPAFGALLKISLATLPGNIKTPQPSLYIELLNSLRKIIRSRRVKCPYTVAVFIADSVCFHFKIPVEGLLVFCDRLRDHDIINRDIWEILYDCGIEEPGIDGDPDGVC